jgi:formyltetrahydrofolate synthetase
MDLGIAVQKACESQSQPLKFLYPLGISIKDKIESIAKSYGAAGVEYSEQVCGNLNLCSLNTKLELLNFEKIPSVSICNQNACFVKVVAFITVQPVHIPI